MALATAYTRAQSGLDAPEVSVEVEVAGGLPALTVVGLVETAVRESRERVRAAIRAAGFEFPSARVTINLGPANLPKAGSRFDLAIAVGVLAATGQVPTGGLAGHEFLGELSLSGQLRPVPALLPALIAAQRAGRFSVLPTACEGEAALLQQARIGLASQLLEVARYLRGDTQLRRPEVGPAVTVDPRLPDLADVRGQHLARRALEIAAAGGHHLLFIGPPGTGKSMLARRLPGLLPALDDGAALESAALGSLAGRPVDGLSRSPPFRAPHHTATAVAMVGGGQATRPGEISLAHNGVLFLDELPEFPRAALEALREPLETGAITIARARRTVQYPARFQLLAAMNPCPCGFAGDQRRECRCSPQQAQRYRSRISGPLLDRLDLHVALSWEPPVTDLVMPAAGESSRAVRARVTNARLIQQARASRTNAGLGRAGVTEFCQPEPAGRRLLAEAAERLRLSARACDRVLRVARTIADLGGQQAIERVHVGEALSLHDGWPRGAASEILPPAVGT